MPNDIYDDSFIITQIIPEAVRNQIDFLNDESLTKTMSGHAYNELSSFTLDFRKLIKQQQFHKFCSACINTGDQITTQALLLHHRIIKFSIS